MPPSVPSYITADDLSNAISRAKFMAIFDDTVPPNGNFAAVSALPVVTDILRRSLVRVSSKLPLLFKKFPPENAAAGISAGNDNVPTLLKDAQLQIAIIFTYRRHAEYVKTYGAEPGGKLMAEWQEAMASLQSAEDQITPNDSPMQPTPENVGGVVYDHGPRLITDSTDGTPNNGDF